MYKKSTNFAAAHTGGGTKNDFAGYSPIASFIHSAPAPFRHPSGVRQLFLAFVTPPEFRCAPLGALFRHPSGVFGATQDSFGSAQEVSENVFLVSSADSVK